MSKIILDTKDDRAELRNILERLHPARAVRFLEVQCTKVPPKTKLRPKVAQSTYDMLQAAMRDDDAARVLAAHIYTDLWMLHMQYGLDIDRAVIDLERLAKTS